MEGTEPGPRQDRPFRPVGEHGAGGKEKPKAGACPCGAGEILPVRIGTAGRQRGGRHYRIPEAAQDDNGGTDGGRPFGNKAVGGRDRADHRPARLPATGEEALLQEMCV